MKHALLLALALPAALGAQEPSCPSRPTPAAPSAAGRTPGASPLDRTGIAWNRGLEAALHRGKPILLFQLLGEFDQGFC